MAGQASRQNGKKGGRPTSEATIRAQLARDYISKEVDSALKPIVARAILQAKKGDRYARDWLSDRAWGKPVQLLAGHDGGPLFTPDEEAITKARKAISEVLDSEDA